MSQDNKIKIRRGLDSALPSPNTEIGELRYSTDAKKLYIDDGVSNVYIGGDVSSFPISNATQTALNGKANTIHSHVISDVTGLQTALNSKLDKVTTVDVEKVYIKNADGTQSTKPTSDFGTVKGTGTINSISKFTASGTIGDSHIFDNGTNVGIGTTSPSDKLDIAGGSIKLANGYKLYNGSTNDSTGLYWDSNQVNISGYSGIIFRSSNSQVASQTERMRITSAGNVGIGTTSPQARLDVRAQGALDRDIAFRVRNSTDTQNFLVVNGAGDVYNNGAKGVYSNTFFGENVGRNTTGGSNTAIGVSALQNNTTGTSNTAIGVSALENNTTGYSNTAIGTYALQNNTTGYSNTAIGLSAGRYISDGSNNTITNNSIFIGGDTRALNDNETNQIVIGYNATGQGSNSVVLGNTSITKTQLRGQVIMGAFASAPTGIEGAIYYDSTTKKHYGFDGTTWNALY